MRVHYPKLRNIVHNIPLNILITASKGSNLYILLFIMFGFLWTTLVFVLKLRSFKRISEKGDGPYRGFGYLSLFSGPINLATRSQRELL